MKRPERSGDDFLADVRSAGGEADSLHVWWLGQSGFLVRAGKRHLLLDPYLSNSLTQKYAKTDKPHVRMTELVSVVETQSDESSVAAMASPGAGSGIAEWVPGTGLEPARPKTVAPKATASTSSATPALCR